MDRKVALKVKIKSLRVEAGIIKKEELKRRQGPERHYLYAHRTGIVRTEAFHTLIAYGFLRGRPFHAIAPNTTEGVNWGKVEKMVNDYGVTRDWENENSTAFNARKAIQVERFCGFKEESGIKE